MLRSNIMYLKACQFRDGRMQEVDFEKAVSHFEASLSFIGFYALAEMHKYGILSFNNGKQISFPKNTKIAAEYFLKAYEIAEVEAYGNKDIFQSMQKKHEHRLRVRVLGAEPSPDINRDEFSLAQVNQLLSACKVGNPDALFKLACFYKTELECHDIQEQRKIAATSEQLKQWEKACLEAAATLYHPHAAYRLAKNARAYKLSADKELEYSCIAADPFFAMSLTPSASIYLRGHTPLREDVVLMQPAANDLPLALRSQSAINFGRMAGIYSNSVTQQGRCILPTEHYTFNANVYLRQPGKIQ